MSYNLLEHEDPTVVAMKLQKLKLLQARHQKIVDIGFEAYRPHPKQDLFHRAGAYKRRAFFAGNRTGKSECGTAEDVSWMIGERRWYPKTDPARYAGIPQRPIKALVISTDWDVVHEVFTNPNKTEATGTEGKFWKMFPRGYVKRTKRNHGGVIVEIEGENGSVIRFDTVQAYKKDPQGAESTDYDLIHVDEPCPKKMYSAKARGTIDRGGSVYFMLTPLKEPWIFDMFYGEDSDVVSLIRSGAFNVHNHSYWSVSGSIHDNPYLSPEAIELVLAEFDEEERECREFGIPTQFAGLVYKEFNYATHVLQQMPSGWSNWGPPMEWPVYWHIDPHPQTPTAVTFTTVGPPPANRKYIFHEIFKRGTVEDIAGLIKLTLEGRFSPRAGLGDPCMWNEDELTGTCWATDFMAHGLYLERAVKDLERGIMAAKQALKGRNPLDGSPNWMVSPACRRFIREIKSYSWDKDNKPVDKDDHMMECFYREVLANPQWIENGNASNFAIPDVGLPDNPLADEVWNERNMYDF